ncbi:chloride channel [Paraphysoderma sedebokerense]|nr:chloride channel [Paraphysoderma sedebokerense]
MTNGLRVWAHDYSTIDFIHDNLKHRAHLRALRSKGGVTGIATRIWDSLQGWLLITVIGIICGGVAAFIDISQDWLTDLKSGYCMTNFSFDRNRCCKGLSGAEQCTTWVKWSESPLFQSYADNSKFHSIDYIAYVLWGCLYATLSAILVKITASPIEPDPSVPLPPESPDSISSSYPPRQTKEQRVVYHAAGSGIPEVKTILGGFVIRGFLGIKTLWVKSLGLILSVSSGMNLGKEGPLVHIACCIGNVMSRFSTKYNKNEGKRRELLSAAASAGVSVAFGAPIGGVLFSLEEVSYYFPSKTMIRSFFCALVAAIVLKAINPFGTGKLVLFQVTYDNDWHVFEVIPFLVLGVFGGLYGAAFNHLNITVNKFRRLYNIHPVGEVVILSLCTAVVAYLNPFTAIQSSELVAELFSECHPEGGNENNRSEGLLKLCEEGNMGRTIKYLAMALVVKSVFAVLTHGIKVPSGIFVPSMAAGGLFGRMLGEGINLLYRRYPDMAFFSFCSETQTSECIIPGVYAIVGAAAALSGVTRMTVSLSVIMFELTGALTYVLPIMLAIMVAKWVGDAFSTNSIYNLYIEMNGHPYLDHKKSYLRRSGVSWYQHQPITPGATEDGRNGFNNRITEIVESGLDVINVDDNHTGESLKRILDRLAARGYTDSGFPIVDRDFQLIGYIAYNELDHALRNLAPLSPYSSTTQLCHFRNPKHEPITPIDPSISVSPSIGSGVGPIPGTASDNVTVVDFSVYVDYAPLSVSINSTVDLILEIFKKLGIRYVCVVDCGKYKGMIHKKRLLAWLKGN